MTPSTSNSAYWGGDVPWVSSKDIKALRIARGEEFITREALQETRLRVCPVGSVLVVVRSGILAHTLPIAVADAPLSINQDLKSFYCPDRDMNEWLALSLRSLAPEILTNNRKDGTTVQSVRYEELCDLIIPVPPSAEQKRITTRLEELLERVRDTRNRLSSVPTTLKRFRQAVLSAACSGKLTEGWRRQHQHVGTGNELLLLIERARKERAAKPGTRRASLPKHLPSDDIEDDVLRSTNLPESWTLCRIDQIATVCLGGTPSRKEPSYWKGELSWVSSGEVANCRINSTRERITREGLAASNAKIHPKGTVLIAMIGEGKTRGQAAILETEASTNQNVAGLVFDAGNVCSDYVWYWALSEYEKNRAAGRGGVQPALNGEKVRAMTLPLPPLEEQKEIVRTIEHLLRLSEIVQARLASANKHGVRLTQSLLAKAFRGELVPTEAEMARREGRYYEPAPVLLERIKAAKASLDSGNALRSKQPAPRGGKRRTVPA
jgi:type I restriction enzyme S subunit